MKSKLHRRNVRCFEVFLRCRPKEATVEEEAAAAAELLASKRLKGKSYREAAEVLEKESKAQHEEPPKVTKRPPHPPSTKGVKQTAKPTPSGLIPEVVIPASSKSLARNDPSSSPSSPTGEGADSEDSGAHKRKRRIAAKRTIIISDDDDDESDVIKEKKPTKKSKISGAKSAKKRRISKRDSSPSSDYRGNSSDDTESDFEMDLNSDEEVKPSKGKQPKHIPKPKATGRAKPSKPAESEGTENDEMDVEIDKPTAKGQKKAGKRKAADEGEKPKKKAKRTDSDPWKLGSRAVQNEWTYMQAPPFEMFHWARVVVDEYTYLDGKIHALVTNLTANRQWVLSGTPPIHDFGALKTIAAFLDVHLGIDDDGEGRSAEVKKRTREQTGIMLNRVKLILAHLFCFSC